MSDNIAELLAELQATVGYLNDDVVERVETFDFEESVAVRDELRRVKRKADEAIGMIDAEMLRQLEAGSRDVGARTFKRTRRMVNRHDHDKLIALAIKQGVEAGRNPDTGEVNSHEAAEAAVRALAKMFLSPSNTAKVTVVDRLGMDRSEYESREFKGWQVSIFEEGED